MRAEGYLGQIVYLRGVRSHTRVWYSTCHQSGEGPHHYQIYLDPGRRRQPACVQTRAEHNARQIPRDATFGSGTLAHGAQESATGVSESDDEPTTMYS